MGLSEETLLNPGAVSEALKCPVCFDLFDDPVFCGGSPCQHVFCRVCVEQALAQAQQCPTCRAEVCTADLRSHQLINNLLDEVSVRCAKSCGWTGRRDSQKAHAAQCPLSLLEKALDELEAFRDVKSVLAAKDLRIAELEARIVQQDQHVVDVGRRLLAHQVRIAELERLIQGQEMMLTEQAADMTQLRLNQGGLSRECLETADGAEQQLSEASRQGGEDLWL